MLIIPLTFVLILNTHLELIVFLQHALPKKNHLLENGLILWT